MLQPPQPDLGLLPGRVGMHDPGLDQMEQGQQISHHLRYRLILAALPGKDPQELKPLMVQTGVDQGVGRSHLIFAQWLPNHQITKQPDALQDPG